MQYNETMSKWLAPLALVGAITAASGCSFGTTAFVCQNDGQCGANGRCELSYGGLCSFADSRCPSGYSFGELSGSKAGQCVGETTGPIDAAVDAPPDAQACFGTAPLAICLQSAPSAPLSLSGGFNTTTDPRCAALVSGGDYCVVVGTTIAISAKLRATGTRPLVLLASDTISVDSAIDVGSHRNQTPETGAGADPAGCAGTIPLVGGGGAGGSLMGLGGTGGADLLTGSAGGIPAVAVTAITGLRGGCTGQNGSGSNPGTGGHGGGAVYLVAGNAIALGSGIDAAGEGGNPGVTNTSGGGGGGAGGMIVLDARSITSTGNPLILANGGAGGEGSGDVDAGVVGQDSTTIAAASGGTGGVSNGGDGGDGSATAAAGPGGPGASGGVVNPGSHRGGGGGGGGGAGLVKVPNGVDLGNKVSPAVTH